MAKHVRVTRSARLTMVILGGIILGGALFAALAAFLNRSGGDASNSVVGGAVAGLGLGLLVAGATEGFSRRD
jgi:hypothetical protein